MYNAQAAIRANLDHVVAHMHRRDVHVVHVEGLTVNQVPWHAIVVQGEPELTLMRAVAAALVDKMAQVRAADQIKIDRN